MDNLSEQKYLSSKDAGAILGYTHDYISRLCRQGKMSGIQKGREWYVTKEELEAFKGRHEAELAEKKKALSKKFSQIRLEAEARKRALRQQANQTTKKEEGIDFSSKKLKVALPKQFVALAVLAFCLMIPTIVNILGNESSNPFLSKTDSLEYVSSIITEGIQATIYEQSTVVSPVASVFAFMPYLADGYWELFTTAAQLPKETYITFKKIGEGYLVLYLLQGQAISESVSSLNTMGATVLKGYELIGESVYLGGKDILRIYSEILPIKKIFQTTIKYPALYVSNVIEGFSYVQEDIAPDATSNLSTGLDEVSSSIKKNLSLNLASVHSAFSQLAHVTGTFVGSLFEFNLVKKEAKIKAIKLQE